MAFKLPDLPRAPQSDLQAILLSVLEGRDMEALTRLPDFLRDMGRDQDAKSACAAVSFILFDPPASKARLWDGITKNLLTAFFWDIFSWELCCKHLAENMPVPPIFGTVKIGDKVATIQGWSINPAKPSDASGVASAGFIDALSISQGEITISGTFDPASPDSTVVSLDPHATESHPDYEYASTDDNTEPARGSGYPWAVNVAVGNDGWRDGARHWLRMRSSP